MRPEHLGSRLLGVCGEGGEAGIIWRGEMASMIHISSLIPPSSFIVGFWLSVLVIITDRKLGYFGIKRNRIESALEGASCKFGL